MRLRDVENATVWVAIYLFFVLAPLFALLAGRLGPARDFWTELSAALGYVGLAMLGLQFGLTARVRFVTRPWGEDVIYYFHRRISLVAFAFILAHPVILFVTRPYLLPLLNVVVAPWPARYASIAVYGLLTIVVMALWRTRLRIGYETWHISHSILAVVVVAAALAHMIGWGYYLVSPWKRLLWLGLIVLWVALLVFVRIVKPLFIWRRPWRVAEVRAERGDARTLVMQPDGHKGFRIRPGQFGWLNLKSNPFLITGHPFSFSSSADAPDGRVDMTIKNLGDFSATIGGVKAGDRVFLDAPYGSFTAGRPAGLNVFVAGGIGITPMMSMLRTMADRGDRRPVVLLYGGKDLDALTFREEIDALAPRLNLRVVYVLSAPPPGWTGERGFIDARVVERNVPAPYAEHEYFICGPDAMMDAVETALGGLGVPLSNYHCERYSFV
jgi:predicted ferric reductase